MGLKKTLFDLAWRLADGMFAFDRASPLSCAMLERLSPTMEMRRDNVPLRFFVPNSLVQWRVATLFEKEPETIEWIESFTPGDVLFDVGANIGLYTVFAAAVRGCTVLAFEPLAKNYALLNQNIGLNALQARAKALNIGLSDGDKLDVLYLSDDQPGSALCNVGSPTSLRTEQFRPVFEQGLLTFSLDSFLARYEVPFPNHVKIDVDGIEPRIVAGMARTLADPRLRSLSIELGEDEKQDAEVIRQIESGGLRFRHKKHAPMFDGGKYQHIFNFLFTREEGPQRP